MRSFPFIFIFMLLAFLASSQANAGSCVEDCGRLSKSNEVAISGLPIILTDPAGDSNGDIDVIQLEGLSTESHLMLKIIFSSTTPVAQSATAILLDVDQDENTGEPASNIWFALPTQTIGCENLLSINSDEVEVRTCAFPTNVISTIATTVGPDSISFSVPLSLFNDEGNMNLALITGDSNGPYDWMPEVGHGTIVQVFNNQYLPIILRP